MAMLPATPEARFAARLDMLYGISSAVLGACSLQEIVDVAFDKLAHLVPYWRASVTLFHFDQQDVSVYAAGGPGRDATMPGRRIPLHEFDADIERLRRGEVDLVHELVRDDVSRSMRAHLIAPMRWEGELMGSLNLGADRPRTFTDEHVEIAVEAANQLAVAIRQTRLHQQVLAAFEAKSAFLANLSHEIRTPLNAIVGYTDLLLGSTREPSFRADLERIQLAANGLVSLASDILDLAKIEAGRMQVAWSDVPVAELIREVEAVIRPLARQQRNHLVIESSGDVQVIRADRNKLRQALLNLLSNACKFTRDGAIRLSICGVDGAVVLAVSDTGIGIPADDIAHLFEVFTEAHRAAPGHSGRGSGLGLALTRRFCRLMGGDIEVDSEEGLGTTFTIRLPAGNGHADGPATLS